VILKSYIIEQNIKVLEGYNYCLLYGENEGLKEDIKLKITDANKNAEIINFFQEDLLKNKNILNEEINNISLFYSKKIIYVHEATDKVFNQIEDFLENNNSEAQVYIFCSILDRKSKLRNTFEKDKRLGTVACYQDNERTLNNYVSFKLKGYLGLSPQVINLIISNSKLDRRIISNEIIKIKDFFLDKKIEINKLEELLDLNRGDNFDELRDACLLGQKSKVNKLLNETDFHQDKIFFYLGNIINRITKLIETQNINQTAQDEEVALEALKPKVFWKDKPIYIEQLKKWKLEDLERIFTEIGTTELIMKKNSQIKNDLIIKDLMIKICARASSFV